MKIIIVTRSISGGGAERVSCTLANELSAYGDEVVLLVFKSSKKEYSINNRVQIVRLDNLSSIQKIGMIRMQAKTFLPNCIISLGSKYQYLLLAGVFSKYKVILSERNNPASFYNRITSRFVKFCYKRAAGVVFQTQEVKKFYAKLHLKNACVIANPANPNVPLWSEEGHQKVIVSFCRLDSQKNLPLLISSFAQFSKTHPDYKLNIFGDGPQKKSLVNLIDQLCIGSTVSIIPFDKEVHSKVVSGEMFVSSSEYEGISNSLIEAMCMGMPVISTDSLGGGAKELLQGKENGILIPRNETKALVEAMELIASDSSLRASMSRNARHSMEDISPARIGRLWREFAMSLGEYAN